MDGLLDPDARQNEAPVKLAIALLRVSQALAGAQGAAAQRSGVSPLQMRILLDLEAARPLPLTPSHLAERYGISRATLSESLAGLLRRRLVLSRPAVRDARARELTATPRGRRVAVKAVTDLGHLVRLAQTLPDATRAQLLEGLSELIAGFNAAGWIATDRLCVSCRFFQRDRHRDSRHPHHCALIDRPLGPGDLRVDCPEHELATHSPRET